MANTKLQPFWLSYIDESHCEHGVHLPYNLCPFLVHDHKGMGKRETKHSARDFLGEIRSRGWCHFAWDKHSPITPVTTAPERQSEWAKRGEGVNTWIQTFLPSIDKFLPASLAQLSLKAVLHLSFDPLRLEITENNVIRKTLRIHYILLLLHLQANSQYLHQELMTESMIAVIYLQ